MVELQASSGIFTMYIPRTFTLNTVAEITSCLEIVENHSGPTALIITSKDPKIFSGGMDLKFIMKNGASSGVMLFIALMKVFGRLLRLGVPTIAAITGHVVAGGLIMALACDYRIMSKDAGSAKMTEINLGMSLPRGGNGIFNVKVTPDVHRDFILRGKVFTPQECFDRKVVDFLVPADEVYKKAVELAKEVMQFGEKKMVYAMIKTSMYFDQIKISEEAVYRQGELDCLTTPKI